MYKIRSGIAKLFSVAIIAVSMFSCRAAFHVASSAAVIGAVAAHTAITVAAWYAITHPVYVYSQPRATEVRVVVPQGGRVYVVAESHDGRWVRVRTDSGHEGWVRADRFYAEPY